MQIFQALIEQKADLDSLIENLHAQEKDLHALVAAIKERIEHDKNTDAEKRKALERRAADPARAAALRRIDCGELERLQAKTFTATLEEKTEYENALALYAETIATTISARQRIIDLAADAKAEIDKMRRAAVQIDPELLQRYPAGFEKDFEEAANDA